MRAVVDSDVADDSGIQYASLLIAFVDAAITGADSELDEAREALVSATNRDVMIDAAAVIGNFQRMNRIADAMGIELDAPVQAMANNIQEELGFLQFATASNSKPSSRVMKFVGSLLYPIAVKFYRPSKS